MHNQQTSWGKQGRAAFYAALPCCHDAAHDAFMNLPSYTTDSEVCLFSTLIAIQLRQSRGSWPRFEVTDATQSSLEMLSRKERRQMKKILLISGGAVLLITAIAFGALFT